MKNYITANSQTAAPEEIAEAAFSFPIELIVAFFLGAEISQENLQALASLKKHNAVFAERLTATEFFISVYRISSFAQYEEIIDQLYSGNREVTLQYFGIGDRRSDDFPKFLDNAGQRSEPCARILTFKKVSKTSLTGKGLANMQRILNDKLTIAASLNPSFTVTRLNRDKEEALLARRLK